MPCTRWDPIFFIGSNAFVIVNTSQHEWFEGPQSNDSEVVAEENIRSKPKHPRVKKRSALEDVGASNEENVLKVLKKNDQEPAVEKLI